MSRMFRYAGAIALVALVVGAVANSGAAVSTVSKGATVVKKAQRGPRGARGPRGPRGFQGPAGVAGFHAFDGPEVTMGTTCNSADDCSQVQSAIARCPAGEVASGGGWQTSSIDISVGFAKAGGDSYGIVAVNYGPTSATLKSQVICAHGQGVVAGKVLAKPVAGSLAAMRAAVAKR